ncbi:hypothetical protein HanIR_Chr11g0517251 [Helianthus annuus]|nr:hypothetical protein HanIR_Chr11g0517251 [Helianthus annuus]
MRYKRKAYHRSNARYHTSSSHSTRNWSGLSRSIPLNTKLKELDFFIWCIIYIYTHTQTYTDKSKGFTMSAQGSMEKN